MVIKKIIFFLLALVILFSKHTVCAALKLNEIYPAPPTGEYEWIEFYNNDNTAIDIKNYYLTDSSEKKILISPGIIQPFSYNIASTPSGILNNSNQSGKNYADIVYLYDSNNQVIDIATYSGTFDSGKTYAKCPDGIGNWFALNTITKNASNESACQTLTPTPIPTLTPTPTIEQSNNETISVTPSPTPITYNNIYISEVMANPPPGENEWVELFNNNDFSVSLTDWFIDDIENGGSSPKLFSFDIPAKNYGVIEFTSSLFNNTGDSVRLLNFNKSSIDDFEYTSTTQGKTLGRISYDSDEFCLQEPSKGNLNNSCINPSPTPQPTPTKISIPPSQAKTSLKPLINQLIDTGSNSTPINQLIGGGEVLGLSDQNNINSHNLLIRSLLFISFSYSLLTITSIVLKIKFACKKLISKNYDER